MLVLVIALVVNLVALNSQDTSTISSHASTGENPVKNLPSLPAGCVYQHTIHGEKVVCPTNEPTKAINFPINIALPELPPECHFATTTNGDTLQCTPSHEPIPTVPVQLPTDCVTAQNNMLVCKNTYGKSVRVPLPSLPAGCMYSFESNTYNVVCER